MICKLCHVASIYNNWRLRKATCIHKHYSVYTPSILLQHAIKNYFRCVLSAYIDVQERYMLPDVKEGDLEPWTGYGGSDSWVSGPPLLWHRSCWHRNCCDSLWQQPLVYKGALHPQYSRPALVPSGQHCTWGAGKDSHLQRCCQLHQRSPTSWNSACW